MPTNSFLDWKQFVLQALEDRATCTLQYLPPSHYCTIDHPTKLRQHGRFSSIHSIITSSYNHTPLYKIEAVLWDFNGRINLCNAIFVVPSMTPSCRDFRTEWIAGCSICILRPIMHSVELTISLPKEAVRCLPNSALKHDNHHRRTNILFDIEYFMEEKDILEYDKHRYDFGLFTTYHDSWTRMGCDNTHVASGHESILAGNLESENFDWSQIKDEGETPQTSPYGSPNRLGGPANTPVTSCPLTTTQTHLPSTAMSQTRRGIYTAKQVPPTLGNHDSQLLKKQTMCLDFCFGDDGPVDGPDVPTSTVQERNNLHETVHSGSAELDHPPSGAQELGIQDESEGSGSITEVEYPFSMVQESCLLDAADGFGSINGPGCPFSAAEQQLWVDGPEDIDWSDPTLAQQQRIDKVEDRMNAENEHQEQMFSQNPNIHHFNWFGDPVLERNYTAPEVSLFVILSTPKAWSSKSIGRKQVVYKEALNYIDPVMFDGNFADLSRHRGHKLLQALTGCTFRLYTEQGTWVRDSYGLDDDIPQRSPEDPVTYLAAPWLPVNGWFKNNFTPSRKQYLAEVLRRGKVAEMRRRNRPESCEPSRLRNCVSLQDVSPI